MKNIYKIRQDFDLPACIKEWGWEFHHLGIPTDKVMPGERYLPHLKFHVSGFASSPFEIEWMRFDKDCPVSDLIKSVPHIAFRVENIDAELKKHDLVLLSEPGVPSGGVRTVMIRHNGAPIELIEFQD